MVKKQKDLVIPKKLELVKPADDLANDQSNTNKDMPKSDKDFLNEIKY